MKVIYNENIARTHMNTKYVLHYTYDIDFGNTWYNANRSIDVKAKFWF